MIKSILRSVGSVILALAVAFVLIALNELPGYFFHPFPEGFDQNDTEACRAHVAGLPTWLLAAGAAGWGVAVLASVWLATLLGTGRHPAHG
ncbi:MAG: hypothetical protein HY290_28965, partial [Planctomycetia bacterium]|nr:hypothetical protein [Planctomycetia bacterium]